MKAFHEAVVAATTVADLEEVVRGAIRSSDLMEFVRFDVGDVLRKGRGEVGLGSSGSSSVIRSS